MRALYWLWVMFLLVCLVTDAASYWLVRDRLGQSLELALDGALVGSIAEEDLIWGRQLSRKERAEAWAGELLRQNMAGPLASSLSFRFSLNQEKDRIWAEGRAKVRIPFLLGILAGQRDREIAVNKTLSYQGQYK